MTSRKPKSFSPDQLAALRGLLARRTGATLTEAEGRRRERLARAALRELDLKERRRELLPTDEVVEAVQQIANETRDAFLNLPARLCDTLATLSDPKNVFKYLDKEIRRVLLDMSEAQMRLATAFAGDAEEPEGR